MKQGDVNHFINETFKHPSPVAAAEAIELLHMSEMKGIDFSKSDSVKSSMGIVSLEKVTGAH